MIFDLVFLAVAGTTAALLLGAVVAGLRGRGRRAMSLLVACGIGRRWCACTDAARQTLSLA